MDESLMVTVDGVSYPVESLSSQAVEQFESLRFVDQEIARVNAQLAVLKTARIAYAQALGQLVPKNLQ